MIIARLLSSEPWSVNSNQVYSVEGADAVISSAHPRVSQHVRGAPPALVI
jgi:hypothetical protein